MSRLFILLTLHSAGSPWISRKNNENGEKDKMPCRAVAPAANRGSAWEPLIGISGDGPNAKVSHTWVVGDP